MTSTIYKIYCKNSEITDIYVGSTDDFNSRCLSHYSRCRNPNSEKYNLKVYRFIRENGGFQNWLIEEIIKCEEDTKYDAEVHYFKTLNSNLNTYFPRRSSQQYYLDNKDIIKKKVKIYADKNKEKISLNMKKYYAENKEKYKETFQCDCGSLVRKYEINRHNRSQKHQKFILSK